MLRFQDHENSDGELVAIEIITDSLPMRLEAGHEALEPDVPEGEPTDALGRTLKAAAGAPVTAWMGDHPIATQVLDPVAAKMLLSLDLWAWWGVTELKLLAYANDQHPHRFRTDIWANAGCAADHGALLDLPLNLGPAWIRVHGSMAASVYVYLGHRWSPVIARDAQGGPLDLRSDVPIWTREATRAAYRLLCPTESEAEAQRWLDRMRDGQWWGGKWDRWAV